MIWVGLKLLTYFRQLGESKVKVSVLQMKKCSSSRMILLVVTRRLSVGIGLLESINALINK